MPAPQGQRGVSRKQMLAVGVGAAVAGLALQSPGNALAASVDSLNVRDFGAKGDGASDDAPAIQAAIQNAANTGGAVVFFPAGTYLIGSTLTTFSNMALSGVSPGASVLKARAGPNADVLQSFKFTALTNSSAGGAVLRTTIAGGQIISIAVINGRSGFSIGGGGGWGGVVVRRSPIYQ